MKSVLNHIGRLAEGYSLGSYKNKTYGILKETFNTGKSFKVFAEELGGTDVMSLNYYRTTKGGLLKPCEMPEDKVIDFLKNVELEQKKETNEY